jgi:hypothetical protein
MLRSDTIYVTPTGAAFHSPDGIGRIFHDSEDDAEAETGLSRFENATEYESGMDFDPNYTYEEFMASYDLNADDDPSLIMGA